MNVRTAWDSAVSHFLERNQPETKPKPKPNPSKKKKKKAVKQSSEGDEIPQ
jgi:hypothetical protein